MASDAPLHLIKLCVGIRDPAQLRAVQARRVLDDPPLRHLTRQTPKRAAEIVAGGSLFWVIAGTVLVRQRVTAIQPARRPDGTPCTALILDPELVAVAGRPVKAFQGWRYLKPEDAPEDLRAGSDEAALPHRLATRLRELGLL